jgi:hypothetical protein
LDYPVVNAVGKILPKDALKKSGMAGGIATEA